MPSIKQALDTLDKAIDELAAAAGVPPDWKPLTHLDRIELAHLRALRAEAEWWKGWLK